jgi:Condensation domain
VLFRTSQVLLAKYSCQEDIVVGTPFANRNVPGTEGLLGCFVNTLAIRMDTPQSSSVAAALSHTKAAVTAGFAHGATPFAKVVDSIGAVRSASFAPIYQVSPAEVEHISNHTILAFRRTSDHADARNVANICRYCCLTKLALCLQVMLLIDSDEADSARAEEHTLQLDTIVGSDISTVIMDLLVSVSIRSHMYSLPSLSLAGLSGRLHLVCATYSSSCTSEGAT